MKAIVAIDPGAGGALAFVVDGHAEAWKCPKDARGMFTIYNHCISSCWIDSYEPEVYIERVHAFPTDARNAAFNFGCNYGKWLGIIGSSNIEPNLVAPITWQKEYKPLPKIKAERKRELKRIASEMFPSIKITLYNCDALLIAAWAHNHNQQEDE
tara:strand:- start:1519 stop:1983 length:465 start_codon:yes stop_codon:yes gene_type:complete